MDKESSSHSIGDHGELGPSTSSAPGPARALEDPPHPPSPNALKVAATECLNSWISYLQMLNSLCSAGLRLSQSLQALSQVPNLSLGSQCQASWDELTRSTVVASHAVKTHIAAAMQDLCIGETFTEADALRQQEHNQQIITENILTFVNLQYQFSIAGCECLGAMAMCPQCQTIAGGIHDPDCHMASLQQCFARLYNQDMRSQMSSPHTLDSPREQLAKSPQTSGSDGGGGHAAQSRGMSPLGIGDVSAAGTSGQPPPTRGSSPIYAPPQHQQGGSAMPAAVSFIETMRGPLPNPGQLHTMKGPFPGSSGAGMMMSRALSVRSPLHFPLFPLTGGQRRWSEAAASGATIVVGGDASVSVVATGAGGIEGDGGPGGGNGNGGAGTMRRWSMPWDCGRPDMLSAAAAMASASASAAVQPPHAAVASPWHQRYLPSKLVVPTQERSRSTTPEGPGTITSGEGLAEAIQLLSCRPQRCVIPHLPGQSTSYAGPSGWPETHEERILRRFPGHMQRGNWQSVDSAQPSGNTSVTEHYDIFPAGMPLTSRKSSSSTDSSSCLSIHSRSTTSGSERGGSENSNNSGGGDAMRMHSANLYSMWSGNEHLPFIRLPESQEPQDDSDTEETPTDQSAKLMFPKPI